MPRAVTTTLNYQLTNYAQGHMNDIRQTQELAERLCPTVQVPGTTGQFKKFDDLNSFNIYETSRTRGGDPTRIEFKATDGTYSCKPQALEVTVDQEDRRDAGDAATGMLNPDELAVRALLNAQALSHTKKVVDTVLSAITAEPGMGEWSNPDIDPIDQLDQLIDELATACGDVSGIKLTLSLTGWRTLRNHPKAKGRCAGVQVGGITLDQLNSILAIPVDTKVYAISYNTKKLGQTASKSRLLSGVVLLSYGVPSPSQYDPSAFKRFTAGVNGVMGVRSWSAPNGLYEGHFVDWSEDIVETSTIARKKIAIS